MEGLQVLELCLQSLSSGFTMNQLPATSAGGLRLKRAVRGRLRHRAGQQDSPVRPAGKTTFSQASCRLEEVHGPEAPGRLRGRLSL